ncbi:hypothetical protein LCGC14_3020630 [marine sediment metagenome]|uniref:Uncharacterized protein n=1 Tax=marine sediment metagenome TaxID=412755 RepID=A0A0F8WVW7_9ZZZZ
MAEETPHEEASTGIAEPQDVAGCPYCGVPMERISIRICSSITALNHFAETRRCHNAECPKDEPKNGA